MNGRETENPCPRCDGYGCDVQFFGLSSVVTGCAFCKRTGVNPSARPVASCGATATEGDQTDE